MLPVGTLLIVTIAFGLVRERTGRHFGSAMRWFRRGLPLAVEVIMLLGTARLALILLSNQGYFDRFPEPYEWLVSHGPPFSYEWAWGSIAATASLLKALGVLLCLIYRRDPVMLDLAYGFRLFGWLASCIVWGAFSISLTVWDPLTYASIASSCALGLALWGLMMGPAMPDDDVG